MLVFHINAKISFIYDLMLFSNSMYKIINFDDVVGQIQ